MVRPRSRESRSSRNLSEIADLTSRSAADAPPPGSLLPPSGRLPREFTDLALSQYTLSGLERGKFSRLTRIQQLSLPHSLAGRDILGCARTGSGKTLAFVIPLLEKLYRSGWQSGLSVGGLVISPTRELAVQIYEVVRVVGFRHGFPCGLVMGGSDFRKEQEHIHQISVMICTPGRLLQHLQQSATMDVSQLQVLVLDEADRLLDMGFKEQLKDILEYLPKERQTMLFSATQTKSVRALAKLSLKNPEFISVLELTKQKVDPGAAAGASNDKGRAPTPANLTQVFSVCQLPDKLDVLYSFIRSHLHSKTIVFLSSCKQVKYVDAVFRRLRPGIPLMCIHGKIKQQKRMYIYYDFIKKPAAVLFATDIAARGLDFPAVDWVVQVDCPEDVPTYIHRVGRTARFKNRGKALLLLLPNEANEMVPMLRDAQIPIVEKKINPNRKQSITPKLQAEVAKDAELRMIAQQAFKSYLRSVHLQTDKKVFNVKQLPMGAFAQSLGLANTPRVKFTGVGGEKSREEQRQVKNMPYSLVKLNQMLEQYKEDEDVDVENDEKQEEDIMALVEKVKSVRKLRKVNDGNQKSQWEKLLGLKASDAVSQSRIAKLAKGTYSDDEMDSGEDDDDEGDGLILRGTQKPIEEGNDPQQGKEEPQIEAEDISKKPSKKQLKHLKISSTGTVKGRVKPTRVEFDEEGNEIDPFAKLADEIGTTDERTYVKTSMTERQAYLERLAQKLKQEDVVDKERERARIREKHREMRLKKKGKELKADDEEDGQVQVTLGGYEDHSEEEESSDQESEASTQRKRPRGSQQEADDEEDSDSSDSETAQESKRPRPSTADVEAEALRLIQAQGL